MNFPKRVWCEEGRDPTFTEFWFEGGISDWLKALCIVVLFYGGEFFSYYWKGVIAALGILGVGILIGMGL